VKPYGFYNFWGCDLKTIGKAWAEEKKTRKMYEEEIKIINEKKI